LTIEAGKELGAYRVSEPLGSGGMGEVWRAEDTSLGREVALKILPEEVATDSDRLSRFEREARLLASLNHPNIATLFGLEQHEGQQVLVMELVEGSGLDELIAGGPVAEERAIEISLQLADALEAAHAQGIVHRDLKPANIRIRPDGTVKVLDFGLAKAWRADDSRDSLSQSPTMTRHATVEGVILGTAAYMSPEQARGQAVDKRADIWAFGVVLWQMLTGRRLFDGDTVSDILASVLKEEPDLDLLPDTTPTSIRRLLRRCLQKDPKTRLHDIADARLELTDDMDDEAVIDQPSSGTQPRTGRATVPWLVAVIALAFATWAWIASKGAPDSHQRIVASIPPPAGTEFLVSSSFAVSPDGVKLVYGARAGGQMERLWLQSLEGGTAQPLPGTERGRHAFWSPDGRAIGFFADDKLKKLTLENGVIEILADAPGRASGAWSRDGVIVATRRNGMFRVPAAGGTVESVADDETDNLEYLHPSFLPDGTSFLYLARNYSSTAEQHQLRVGFLDGQPHKVLLESNSNGVYASSGDLLWWQEGHLRAQNFDPDRLQLSGEARILQPEVLFDPRIGLGLFSVASTGTLVYRSGGVVAGDELAFVDRDGSDLGAIGDPGNFYHPRVSPDGTMVAVDQSDTTNRGDIWIYDVERKSGTRLTSAPQDESLPIWSPDGRQIVFSSTREVKHGAVHIRSLSGGDDERVLYGGPSIYAEPWSWSAAGFIVVEYANGSEEGVNNIGVLSVSDESFAPVISTQFSDRHGAISPDGRLMAYDSNETGRREVYVQTFPDPVDRWRVSIDGGWGPVWRRDGRELYFVKDNVELMVVAVEAPANGSSYRIGKPQSLLAADFKGGGARQPFDTIDGRSFLVNRNVGDYETAPLTLVVNALAR
jgi:serine/threonine protein kinase/Tol biopolymer transport system component